MAVCTKTIPVWVGRRTEQRNCGSLTLFGKRYCQSCEQRIEREYPQGWRFYPGDTCKHGMYTGGSGIDWMCGHCESGE